MAWFYADSQDAERWSLGGDTREAAIAAARGDRFDDGAPFTIAEAEHQPWRFDAFDCLDEEFDEVNEELADCDGDPPSVDAGMSTLKGGLKGDLRKHMEATLEAWVREHGNPTAWALNFTAYHEVPATTEWHELEQSGGGG